MEVINPELRDLRQKFEDLRNSVSKVEGEVELLKVTTRDTSRQTIWQFIIFTATMGVILIAGVKYQSDVLRHEMDLRFEAHRMEFNARFDAIDKRFDAMDKRFESMEKRFEELRQEVRAGRK